VLIASRFSTGEALSTQVVGLIEGVKHPDWIISDNSISLRNNSAVEPRSVAAASVVIL
jgi:hypothetical protein